MPQDSGVTRDPCDTVREFVRLANQMSQAAIGELFADDAVFRGPDRVIRRGKPSIIEFFTGLDPSFIEPRLPMRPTAIARDGNVCLLAFQSKTSEGEYEDTAVDQFTVNDDGKIAEFVVYIRPGVGADEYAAYHASHRDGSA